ncbi:MAG: hypothetical protein ABI454_03330 [Sphingomicrobium sp.]
MRDKRVLCGVALLLLTGLLAPTPAFAYGGPGLGAGAIAVTLGILGSIFAAILGVVYYPIKRMIKKLKKGRQLDRAGRNTE